MCAGIFLLSADDKSMCNTHVIDNVSHSDSKLMEFDEMFTCIGIK